MSDLTPPSRGIPLPDNTFPLSEPSMETPKAGRVALRFFFRLMAHWECTPEQQRILLGGIDAETFAHYQACPAIVLPHDTLYRLSYLAGIHAALRRIFGQSSSVYQWVRRPNSASLFEGASALEYMLSGSMGALADVRQYLDAMFS